MADDKKKLDFGKLGARKRSPEKKPLVKKVYKEVIETPATPQPTNPPPAPKAKSTKPKKEIKEKKKVGRKSWKKAGVNYTRLAFDTPIDTKRKLKELLHVKFFDTYISQDEMINEAINDFIKKHSKK